MSAIRRIRSAYRDIGPDVVHLHSSFAGLYGRLAGLPRHRLIYTPHGYSFENPKEPRLSRAAFYLAEQMLSLFGGRFAGVGPHECKISEGMIGARDVSLLPNFALIPSHLSPVKTDFQKRPLRGAMIGRLTPVKDPEFFLDTWRFVRERTNHIEFVWIGGGDDEMTEKMVRAGIELTGWVTPEEVLSFLRRMDFYVHTSASEGNPMSVLEAAALELPIVARDIPALRALGLQVLGKTPSDLAGKIVGLLEADAMSAAKDDSARLRQRFSRERQVAALQSLYC